MEVWSIEEQAEADNVQAEGDETLINEVINDFLNSFDEVDRMLAQQPRSPIQVCNVTEVVKPGTSRYFLRSSKHKK